MNDASGGYNFGIWILAGLTTFTYMSWILMPIAIRKDNDRIAQEARSTSEEDWEEMKCEI